MSQGKRLFLVQKYRLPKTNKTIIPGTENTEFFAIFFLKYSFNNFYIITAYNVLKLTLKKLKLGKYFSQINRPKTK